MRGPQGAVLAVPQGVAAGSGGHQCAGDLAVHRGDTGDHPWVAVSGEGDVAEEDLLQPMLVRV